MATVAPTAPAQETARELLLKSETAKADETNKARTGKGTRVRVGQTRGKNPQVISWEAFDDSQPDTLPTTTQEFLELTKVTDEKQIVSILIDGYNAQAYVAASDPIAEFVNPAWPDEMQKQFRIVVRNFAAATGQSLDDAVAQIKPNIDKAFAASQNK